MNQVVISRPWVSRWRRPSPRLTSIAARSMPAVAPAYQRGGACAMPLTSYRAAAARCRRPSAKPCVRSSTASPTYRDPPPAQIPADLLDQGQAPASPSTPHRLLCADQATGERRAQRLAQQHATPRLVATAAHQVWTWDITKLPTTRHVHICRCTSYWTLQPLRLGLDGLAPGGQRAGPVRDAGGHRPLCRRLWPIDPAPGPRRPMIARTELDLMAELGLTCSHSRPCVSNDNPVEVPAR